MEFLKNFDNAFKKLVMVIIVFVAAILICIIVYDIHGYIGSIAFINSTLETDSVNLPNYVDVIQKKMHKDLIFLIVRSVGIVLVMSTFVLIFVYKVMNHMKTIIAEEQYMYEILTNISTEAIFIVDETGQVIEANKKAKEITDSYEIENTNIKDYMPIKMPITEKSQTNFSSNVKEFPVEIHPNEVNINNKKHYILYLIDLTKRVQYEKKLIKIADTDPLTGLYNRRYFMKKMQNAMNKVKENHAFFSIIILDIDNFKCINDQYGHDAGDIVLKQFGKVLMENTRNSDVICRIGGEEFMILMMNTKIFHAEEIVNRILKILETIQWNFDDVTISFSAGIEEVNEQNRDDDSNVHIKRADQLLYKAKRLGKGRVEIA